ncbi:hypothetical protein BGX28_009915 [Mortierella sp. GBA30]|nr:hypothetical protein BGX28_009915 [Mortierella sp. GBA30]
MSSSKTVMEFALQRATPSDGYKLLFAIVALVVYKYRSHAIGTLPRRDLKQPKGAVPLLGHMPLMASIPSTKLYQFFERQHNELGPVWSISLPFIGRMIQGDSPEILEHILKTNFRSYEKGPILATALSDLFGRGIVAADGAEWKFQRKLASHIFSVKAFREYTSDVFVIEGRRVLEHLRLAADTGTIVDLHELMHHFTLDSIGTVSFGKSFGCLDNIHQKAPFAVSFDGLTAACSDRLLDPIWKIRERLTSVGKKVQYDKTLIQQHTLQLMEKRRKEGYHAAKKDLLQIFMETKDEDGAPLSDELIVDIILNFTIAGRDTTAQAISWTFYTLLCDGTNEDVLKKLIHEVDDVFGDEEPSYDTYKRQKFAEACFYESLRLYPSGPRNLRLCVADDVLPGGIKIHKGEWVSWSSYVMGRSEGIWGPDAKQYKPSRWVNAEKPSPSKFNAFHAGPRTCLGQQYATIEALTIIGMILQSFELKLVDASKEPQYGVSLTMPMQEGLPVRVFRRDGSCAV